MAITITTSRLLLQPLTITDSVFMRELVNTEGWIRFIGDRNIRNEADVTAYIQKIIDDPNIDYWVARLSCADIPIGIASFIKRDYLEYHDIGFALLPLFTSFGYAYEATRALVYYMIDTDEHIRISSIVHASNNRSIVLLNKLGLEFQRIIRVKGENLQLYEASVDKILITGVVNSFFSAFTNKRNQPLRLDMLNDICIPGMSIANRNKLKTEILDFTSFIGKRKQLLTDGTLMGFEEKEVYEETKIVNGIASRYSQYEKKGIIYRQKFTASGHKFFHLVKIGKEWKIGSVLWEDIEKPS